MTDIEQKALARVNEVIKEQGYNPIRFLYRDFSQTQEALCRAIEQHEAFRQEVSDALVVYLRGAYPQSLGRFISPKPQPDPLLDVMKQLGWYNVEKSTADLRAALEARGLEIREKGL